MGGKLDLEQSRAFWTSRAEQYKESPGASCRTGASSVERSQRLPRADIDAADPGMEWNRWFGSLPAWGDCGGRKLFVFRKR